MKTIHLEILRQGPPHNQLLSPLTEYLALCENHPAVPVRLPFEHAVLQRRLKALQYKEKEEYRGADVDEVRRWMTAILAQVPGLTRELANPAGATEGAIHLRLTLSANELALLPFELASGSYVFGSAGESLALQAQGPVCITREGRREPAQQLEWPPPPDPKILFAAAAPSTTVPMHEHLLALRQIIDPWVAHYTGEQERRERVAEHLKVLPQATLDQIESECATGNYTHVHILSHGIPMQKDDGQRFGLALHDRVNRATADIVNGERLAKAIRPPLRDGRKGFARPVIVTLAACDAGNVGDVVSAGASIAHALHEEGVPLVVASQFPLSFAGSVIMTRVLYAGFLMGDDPRRLLVYLRREMLTQAPGTHDWASIVAYASFPQKFDETLANMQVWQTYRRFEAAFNHIDKLLRPSAETPEPSGTSATAGESQKFDQSEMAVSEEDMKRVKEARRRFDLLLEQDGTAQKDQARVFGIVASAEKRLAELYWRKLKRGRNPKDITEREAIEVRDHLMMSRQYYERTFKEDRSQVWALVQVLALTAVMGKWQEPDKRSRERWELAQRFSEEELELGNPERLSWANANLMELYVLQPLIFPGPDENAAQAAARAEEYALAFRSVTEAKSVNLHSTKRQMVRYVGFFLEVNGKMAVAAKAADRVLKILPESPKYC